MTGAILKLDRAPIFMKVVATLLVNFFTISVEGYYTICPTTLNIKFSIVQTWLDRVWIKFSIGLSVFNPTISHIGGWIGLSLG